jgi:hypothetical protein
VNWFPQLNVEVWKDHKIWWSLQPYFRSVYDHIYFRFEIPLFKLDLLECPRPHPLDPDPLLIAIALALLLLINKTFLASFSAGSKLEARDKTALLPTLKVDVLEIPSVRLGFVNPPSCAQSDSVLYASPLRPAALPSPIVNDFPGTMLGSLGGLDV